MNNYYSFGLMWDNPDAMPNATYQGKEFQTNTFSDGSELALYDFGARMYDPVLGRWHCSDPMYQFDSPYNAMANNPVVNIDPDGMWSIPWGNIVSNLGTYMNTIRTFIVSPRDFVSGHWEYSSSGFGKALQIAGTLLQAWQDGKMIQDAAGEMGRDVQIRIGENTYNAPEVNNFVDPNNGRILRSANIENQDRVTESFNKPSGDPTRGYLKAGDEYTKIVWDPNYVKNGQRGNYRQYWGYKTSRSWISITPINLTYNNTGGISQASLNILSNEVLANQALLPTFNPPFSDPLFPDEITIIDGAYSPGANVAQARREGDQVEAYLRGQYPNQTVYRVTSSVRWPGGVRTVTNQGQISINVRRSFYVFPF
jgi:RHS repeat-associated protein